MGGYTLSSTRELTARSVSHVGDPGVMESWNFARWYQGLHGKTTFHLKAQHMSPNSITG